MPLYRLMKIRYLSCELIDTTSLSASAIGTSATVSSMPMMLRIYGHHLEWEKLKKKRRRKQTVGCRHRSAKIQLNEGRGHDHGTY